MQARAATAWRRSLRGSCLAISKVARPSRDTDIVMAPHEAASPVQNPCQNLMIKISPRQKIMSCRSALTRSNLRIASRVDPRAG